MPCSPLLVGIITAAALGYSPAVMAQYYNSTPISVPGSIADYAIAVNDAGVALGIWIDSNSKAHAYTYQAGVVTEFDYPGAITTIPAAINSKGDIAGYYVDSNRLAHGFILKNGGYQSFDDPNAQSTFVTGMNDADVVCGDSFANSTTAYVFKHGKLNTFADQDSPVPVAVNDKGIVAGNFLTDQSQYAFLYEKGVITTLPNTLGTPYAAGMNNKDTVVGTLSLPYGVAGFFYHHGKLVKYNVPGASATVLNAINDLGAAVGQYVDQTGNQIGFVVTGRLAIRLSVAQSTNVDTYGISNSGAVVGSYLDNGFNTRSFIASPY